MFDITLDEVNVLKKAHIKFLNEHIKKFNISSSFVNFLEALYEQEFNSQKELSVYLNCNKAHTHRTLLKLEILGYIDIKNRINPKKTTIALTEKGKTIAKEIKKINNDFMENIFKNIPDSDKEKFNGVLMQLISNAKNCWWSFNMSNKKNKSKENLVHSEQEKDNAKKYQNENSQVVLELKHINKKYKINNKEYFQALHDINISFKNGELVSIVGESGSGKSTLMNLIGGLDSDFTGKIIASGKSLGELTDKQLDSYRKDKVGFVFQSFNLISHLSILDNVTLALTLSNVSEKEKVERATNMLKMVGLESQLKKKPTQLSGVQKQRVAIARALINNPEIIIADEPTGALDTTTSMQILKILKEIADSGKLVIMVTHSEKVASVSSRVVEISDGKIISDKVNENYKKLKPKENKVKKNEKEKNGNPIKQNLSYWSAIRLSFHNMWASKTKNLLMSFGVAIGIGSLILMLCFSSGITDYISATMKSYSDPTIVTISKKSEEMMSFSTFSEEEIDTLTQEINSYLADNNVNYTITEDNISYGFNVVTMFGKLSATLKYDKNGDGKIGEDEQLSIYYLYTTPPYYTEQNLVEGEMSTSENGIMLTPAVYKFFGEESPIGKKVEISVFYNDTQLVTPDSEDAQTSAKTTIPIDQEITAIVDTSVMSGFPVVYIDYDLFASYYEQFAETPLSPNSIYVQTDSKATSDIINRYLSTREDVSGSIEESLANMFTEMTNIIGTSLTVISMISLLVSAIMILVVMYMSVTERTKEIGVLKSIGARKKDIKRIFSSESFLVGLLSGISGLVFAGILILIVYICLTTFVGFAPLSFKWYYPFIALGVSIVISILSGLYPASKAAKLDTIESLRRE